MILAGIFILCVLLTVVTVVLLLNFVVHNVEKQENKYKDFDNYRIYSTMSNSTYLNKANRYRYSIRRGD